MTIFRRDINTSRCDKAPKYLLDIYEKVKKKGYCKFTYRKRDYSMTNTKFNSVMLLSKLTENKKKTKYHMISVLGPQNIIKKIKFTSTDKGSAVIGTQNNGVKLIVKHDYMIEYMGGVVQIKKDENVWVNKDGKIIIGWHGSYNPPKGM